MGSLADLSAGMDRAARRAGDAGGGVSLAVGSLGARSSPARCSSAGSLWRFCLTKPNVTFLPLALLLIYAVGQRRWRVVVAFGAASLSLVMRLGLALSIPVAALRTAWLWPGPVGGSGRTGGSLAASRINATLRDWIATYGLPSWVTIPAYVAAFALVGGSPLHRGRAG